VAEIRAPITGRMWRLLVSEGVAVAAGEEVAIIESMKLEIAVEAEDRGTIREVLVSEGEPVAEGQALFRFEMAGP
jgi:biotin carboxyl carrier protein